MKTKIKLLAGFVAGSMLFSGIASAAAFDSFSINDETVELTVSGTPDGAVKGDWITIQILNEGKTSDEIAASYTSGKEGTLLEDFVYFMQIPADENGGYSETVSMEGKAPGFYIIRVNGEDATEIYYASKTDRETIIKNIKDNCSVSKEEASVSYLEEKFDMDNEKSTWIKAFDINDPVVFSVTEDGLFKVFLVSVSDLTINNIKEKLTLSAYIAALNENKIDIISYKDSFDLDEKFVAAYDGYVSDKDSFVKNYFEGKDLRTVQKINAVFEAAVLLEGCNNFEGWSDVEEFINSFGEKAGVNMDKFDSASFGTTKKTKLYSYVLGVDEFSDVESFALIVNKKIDELLKGGSSSGSGGSGGGGGGGSTGGGTAGGTTVSKPIVSTDEKPQAPVENKDTFSDLKGFDWAKEAIEALSEKKIVSGTGEGKYEPQREVKREEILAMLLRSFNVEASSEKSDFTDAAEGAWYNGLLAVAKEKGFVSGRPDGTFGVGDNVTRQDVCVMAYKIAKAMGKEFDTGKAESFADENEADSYALDAIYALKNAGVINGKGEGKFAPKATCTRAETAKIIYSLIK